MYLVLILAVAATALPVPEDSAIPNGYPPIMITAPDSMLRKNVLAAILLPPDASPLNYKTNDQFVQVIRKEDVDMPVFTEMEKEMAGDMETSEAKPQPNPLLFSSGSGTFTLGEKEAETLQPAEDSIPSDDSDDETPLPEPAEAMPEELSKPDAPIKPSEDDKRDETLIEEPTDIKEPAPEPSAPITPARPLETTPTTEVHKPIVIKPKPSIFSWRPPFFSFISPDWYTNKLSLSSLPLLSSLNLQSIPFISSINLASSTLGTALPTVLPKVRSTSDADDKSSWMTLQYIPNDRKTETTYASRYYVYLNPTEIK